MKQDQQYGATIRAREPVQNWKPVDGGVRVETNKNRYHAKKIVITAGAWAYKLIDDLEGKAVPERITVGWFQPDQPEDFTPEKFPVFHVEGEENRYYGLPIHTVPGFKIGHYPRGEVIDPDQMERIPTREDEMLLRQGAETYFKGIGPTMNIDTCIITNTPDENFVLDHHPDHPDVIIGAGFSARGFKFASVIGEILSDLAIDGETPHDISMFSIERLIT